MVNTIRILEWKLKATNQTYSIKESEYKLGVVAQTCNLSYSGSGDLGGLWLRPAKDPKKKVQ
jgi:hypothetical protein